MVKVNSARYFVAKGEVVAITVNAVATAPFCSAALGDMLLTPSNTNPITYSFTITAAKGGEEDFDFTAAFAAEAPPNALYELFVEGDGGGGRFTGPRYFQTDLGFPITIEFEVNA